MPSDSESITLGILADTHIPDRARRLPPGILAKFKEAHVSQILHAGDASNWKAVRNLESIAPVTVVQGNRDWILGMKTPRDISQVINGIRITLTHGHRTMRHYLVDKWAYITRGYVFERYYTHLVADYPDSDVIIFGHTHYQAVKWINGKLFFNPGAAYPCKHNDFSPEFGIISITGDGILRTECYRLQSDQAS
jgi:putative phosphoesterase